MRSRAVSPLWLACLFALGGCGDKASVTLTARIESPALTVTEKTLGTQLTGGFVLVLELGPQASAPTSISLDDLGLVRADDRAEVAPGFAPAPVGASFPVEVGIGERRDVSFAADPEALLPADAYDAICAEPVAIAGTVTDTRTSVATPIVSNPFVPSGCP